MINIDEIPAVHFIPYNYKTNQSLKIFKIKKLKINSFKNVIYTHKKLK